MPSIYSDEFKLHAVHMATTSGLTRRKVARVLGVELSELNKWVKMASDETGPADPYQNLLRENERLTLENHILKEEKETLNHNERLEAHDAQIMMRKNSKPHTRFLLAVSELTKTLSKTRYTFEKKRAEERPLRKLLRPLHWLRLQLGLQLARHYARAAQGNPDLKKVAKNYALGPYNARFHRNDVVFYFSRTQQHFCDYVKESFGDDRIDFDEIEFVIRGVISEPNASLLLFELYQASGDLKQALTLYRGLLEGKWGGLKKSMRTKLLREPLGRLLAIDLLHEKTIEHDFDAGGRIGYVAHNSLPYVTQGYATRTQGFVDGLRRCGQDIVVFTRPGFPLNIMRDLSASDVPLFQEIDSVVYRRILEPTDQSEIPNDYIRLAADALEKAFVVENVKTVIAASNYVCALPAIIAARRLGLPSVYEVRGFWEITAKSNEESYDKTADYATRVELESFTACAADRVLTLTAGMREKLISRGVKPERIFLAPNGIQPPKLDQRSDPHLMRKKLDIPEGCPVIGYIGSITNYEGLEDLATACVGLYDRGLDFRLLLVGDEKPRGGLSAGITERIIATFAQAKISNKLIMTGRVPFENVPDYYGIVDIAPIPRKPFEVSELVSPIKPIEAMGFEAAVVVSSVAALTEIVTDGVNGYVFEKGNVGALCDALTRAITDSVTRCQIAAEGKRFALQERTWENIARKVTGFLFDNNSTAIAEESPLSQRSSGNPGEAEIID